jgi:hypothetical protein
MTDASGISQAQTFVQGLNLGALLSLEVNPLWGYLAMAIGLAMCVAGYYLYRFMVAIAAAIAGGALVYFLGPGFGLEGTALLTTAVGAVLVLLIVGWLLYGLAVFVLGGTVGFAFGVVMWMIGSGQFTGLTDLTNLTIERSDLPEVILTAIFPAVALSIVVYAWERRLTTLFTVMLGGLVFAFGLRYSNLPLLAKEWSPIIGSIAIVAGLYLNALKMTQRAAATPAKPSDKPQQPKPTSGGQRRPRPTAIARAGRR